MRKCFCDECGEEVEQPLTGTNFQTGNLSMLFTIRKRNSEGAREVEYCERCILQTIVRAVTDRMEMRPSLKDKPKNSQPPKEP